MSVLEREVLMIFLEHGVLEGGFEVVMFGFVEAVHIELSYKAVNFVMPEVFWQYDFLKFGDVFDGELKATIGPVDDFVIVSNLQYQK